MNMWHRIKRFFGFEKPVLPPPALRPREAIQRELEKLAPGEAIAHLGQALQQAEAAWAARAQDAAATPESLDEQLELLFFCYSQLHPASGGPVDPAYEQLLERIQAVTSRLMSDGSESLKRLDQYIQQYEEYIYLTEAKGQYVLARSEQGSYIRFPFMTGAILKSAKRPAAAKTLAELFHLSRALTFLEMQSAVPWTPISFVDFMAEAKDRKLALITDGAGYYACLEQRR